MNPFVIVMLFFTHQPAMSYEVKKKEDIPKTRAKNEVSTCSEKENGVPYCVYEHGDPDSKLIISVPHAGFLRPPQIPDRIAGCLQKSLKCTWNHHCRYPSVMFCNTAHSMDKNTEKTASSLVMHIARISGSKPHFIISNIQRRKIDLNRSIEEATFENVIATKTYIEYHGFIKKAGEQIKGRGLFLEIHGQTHPEEWIELGYLISKDRLNAFGLEGAEAKEPLNPDYSSIRGLYNSRKDCSFEQLLRGNKSLGYFLEQHGFKTVPSPTFAGPGKGNYLMGGYNIYQHGSLWNEKIDAIQMELPKCLRFKSKVDDVGVRLAGGFVEWMEEVY